MTLSGSCLCGYVRYEAPRALYAPTLCHCSSCRRSCGAHAIGWFTVAANAIVYEREVPLEWCSSNGVWRGFCGRCHSPMTYRNSEREMEIDVTLASLDNPDLLAPADHIHMQDAVAWDRPADGLPQYPGSRVI